MNIRNKFNEIMRTQTEIALATVNGEEPNVRIVNFYYDPEQARLYFATFEENQKVVEIDHNANVSFTTIPKKGEVHVRAKGQAVKSQYTIFDRKEQFSDKIPGYKDTIETVGQFLKLYEISFDQAVVTLDLETSEILKIS